MKLLSAFQSLGSITNILGYLQPEVPVYDRLDGWVRAHLRLEFSSWGHALIPL